MESEFVSYLKKYRKAKNITQEELALAVGVRRETIVRLEMSRYVPSLKLAYNISKELDMSIEEIFSFISCE